jgi:hypothetical protein
MFSARSYQIYEVTQREGYEKERGGIGKRGHVWIGLQMEANDPVDTWAESVSKTATKEAMNAYAYTVLLKSSLDP